MTAKIQNLCIIFSSEGGLKLGRFNKIRKQATRIELLLHLYTFIKVYNIIHTNINIKYINQIPQMIKVDFLR